MKQIRVRSLEKFYSPVSEQYAYLSTGEEQPQASGATGRDDVSANPPSMYKVNEIGNLWDVL